MIVRELFAKIGLVVDEKTFKDAEGGIEKVKAGLGVVVKVAAAASAALATTFGVLGQQAANAGEEVSRLATETGLSTDAFQELAFAAGQAGVRTQDFVDLSSTLSERLQDAKDGSEEMATILRRLGIPLKSATGQFTDAETALEHLSDGLKANGDNQQVVADAMTLLGDNGRRALPFIIQGSAAIREQRREARALGVVLSEEGIAKSKEFIKQQRVLGAVLKGLRNEAMLPLIKAMTPLIAQVVEWVRVNRELIKQNAAKFIKVMASAGRLLFKAFKILLAVLAPVVAVLEAMFNIVKALIFDTGVLTKVIFGLAAAYTVLSIAIRRVGILGVAAAIANAKAWLASTIPLLLIIAAVALVALAIDDFIGFLQGKESVFGEFWNAVTEAWQDTFVEFFEWVEKQWEALVQKLRRGTDRLAEAVDIFGILDTETVGVRGQVLDSNGNVIPASAPIAPPVAPPISGGSRTNNNAMNVNQTINAAPGMDESQIARVAAEQTAEAIGAEIRNIEAQS